MSENLGTPVETTAGTTPQVGDKPAFPVEVKKYRLVKQGIVVSDKMEKTIVVEVEYQKKHPLYKKSLRTHKKFKAHDPENSAQVGDTVRIEECPPVSKDKHFRLIEIVKKGAGV